jgi:hypothetical protein
MILKCYDWAIEQRDKGNCVVGGFHSQIEKDVLHYLLKGPQPLIIALARGMMVKFELPILKSLDAGRLLILSPFPDDIKRVTEETANVRNRMMINLADTIVVGHSSAGGNLDKLLNALNKPIVRL